MRDELTDLPDDADSGDDGGPTFSVEDAEDALLEGDRTFAAGTALRGACATRPSAGVPRRAPVEHRQLDAERGLGAFAYDLTGSAAVVSIVSFGQLGPLLLLSLVGGALADIFDRRKLLIRCRSSRPSSRWRSPGSPAAPTRRSPAVPVHRGHRHRPGHLRADVSALLPILVKRSDLAGAVSLNSANMNLSRVIGPAIGGIVYAKVGVSWVFLGNALSYLFIIGALLDGEAAAGPAPRRRSRRPASVVEGFKVAADDRVVGRCLMRDGDLLAVLLALHRADAGAGRRQLRHRPQEQRLRPALRLLRPRRGDRRAVDRHVPGRPVARDDRPPRPGRVRRRAHGLRPGAHPGPAYPMAVIVGFFYFATVTSLATVLQVRLDDRVRGRVMALWVMAFGGTVAVGGLVAGPIIDWTSVTAVVLFGAAVAAALISYADLRDPGRGSGIQAGPEPAARGRPPDCP